MLNKEQRMNNQYPINAKNSKVLLWSLCPQWLTMQKVKVIMMQQENAVLIKKSEGMES